QFRLAQQRFQKPPQRTASILNSQLHFPNIQGTVAPHKLSDIFLPHYLSISTSGLWYGLPEAYSSATTRTEQKEGIMQDAMTQVHDPAKARAHFENKVAC